MTLEQRISQIENAIVKVGRVAMPVFAAVARFTPGIVGTTVTEVATVLGAIEATAAAHPAPPDPPAPTTTPSR